MRLIRTLIAEDEKPARDRLRLALLSMPDIQIIAEAVNGAQAAELIDELKPALVFLDVQMPVMNGFEALQRCVWRPAVIFTTAYDEYALKAFDVHAVDYLLKPYSKERLRDAVAHALERIRQPREEQISRLVSEYGLREPFISRISIRQGRSYKILPAGHADFFKAENGLTFCVENGERRLIDKTLAELEQGLDPARFLRVHRNAIANIDKIVRVIPLGRGRLAAEFPGGELIDVGKTHLEAFRRAMRLK